MRLNRHQKSAIVRAIMDDIPEANYAALREKLQAAVCAQMSPEVRKLYQKNPKALRRESVYGMNSYGMTSIIVGDVTDLEDIAAPFVAEAGQRAAFKTKLNAMVEGVTTLKQLKEILPEFEKYFPTEEKPTANLPAVANLVADAVKLGWNNPQTKE